MGGKKRQETTAASGRAVAASRQSQAAQPHAKVADVGCGCMSGILHLVSKYHTRRKFLTFGRKQEAQKPSSPKPETTTTIITITCQPPPQPQLHDKVSPEAGRRSSLELPRSPVLPAEIRSSGSANSPRVVARLMGIEDFPASPTPSFSGDSAAEKRRKLLGALEKCDEDLKALKKIIDAVRESQTPPRAAVGGGGGKAEGREKREEAGEDEEREDEPSPLSVLDYHQQQLLSRSPPLTGYSKRTRNGQVLRQQQKQHREKTTRKLKPGEEDNSSYYFLNRSTPTPVIKITTLKSVFLPAKARPPPPPTPPPINTARRTAATPAALAWSRVVVENVEEVCRDIERGQTREVGNIGLLIQDFIFKDLLEEVIKEMTVVMSTRHYCDHVFGSSRIISLPFQAYRRKLSF